MDKRKYFAILTRALDEYGLQHQCWIAIEEMSELTKALCKWWRAEGSLLAELKTAIVDEVADVLICMDQIIKGFDISKEVNERIQYKVERLDRRINDEQQEV
jgi:hypothetical protein